MTRLIEQVEKGGVISVRVVMCEKKIPTFESIKTDITNGIM